MTSTKQFVVVDGYRRKARNASGMVSAQYFGQGETISGTDDFYTLDHLGSVREVTNSSGTVQSVYAYSPYGQQTAISQAVASDIGFARYYLHGPSGLSLTWFEYDPTLTRWLTRDPIEERAGANVFRYVKNAPCSTSDPLGLSGTISICAIPTGAPAPNGDLGGLVAPSIGHCWINWEPDSSNAPMSGPWAPVAPGTYGNFLVGGFSSIWRAAKDWATWPMHDRCHKRRWRGRPGRRYCKPRSI